MSRAAIIQTCQEAFRMGYKSWMFSCILILAVIRKLLAEDKACDLPNVENGRIAPYYYSFKKYYFPMKKGEKLLYSCLAGYSTETGRQDGRVNCTADGWVPIPKCYKKCVKPSLENGAFSGMKLSYNIWELLQYHCHPSYQTPEGHGEATLQCLQDGWSAQPQCMEASKPALGTCLAPDLLHGHYHTVQKVFRVNEKLKYKCSDGYLTAGGNTTEEVLCHLQGWSLVPKCIKLRCSSLDPVEHGGVYPKKDNYEEGDVVQFYCLEGYSLRGTELIQCYYFGWYPEFPACEERRNKCPPPPQPPNTKLLTNLRTSRQGDIIHFECEHPFQLSGTAEIRCENGKWTSPPRCFDVGRELTTEDYRNPEIAGNCSFPPVVKNSIIINYIGSELRSYKSGSQVTYACHPLHLMKGSNTVHCDHGTWTAPPICLEPCLAEENPGNYNLEMRWKVEGEFYFLHGDLIEFVCKPGYVLPPLVSESQLLVQCNNGKLKYPICILKDQNANCSSPPFIENGVVMGSLTANYDDGSSVQYSCNEYHFLQGSRTVFCSRGQWTTPPVCIEPCTLSQEEMANNNLVLRWSFDNRPYFLHGEFVEFICKAYHVRLPSSSLSDYRVQCKNGKLLYPQCIGMKG